MSWTKKRSFGSQQQQQKTSRGVKRKECPQGCGCPFQHEYQHTLEFSHTLQPFRGPDQAKFPSKSGSNSSSSSSSSSSGGGSGGNRPVLNGNSGGSSSGSGSVFAGTGIRLGGTLCSAGSERIRRVQAFDSEQQVSACPFPHVGDRTKSWRLPPTATTKTTTSTTTTTATIAATTAVESEGYFFCERCATSVPLPDLEVHLLRHERDSSNRNSTGDNRDSSGFNDNSGSGRLRAEQDDEYDESVLREVQQLSRAAEAAKRAQLMEDHKLETEAILQSRRDLIHSTQIRK
jgi:hypothetical protein